MQIRVRVIFLFASLFFAALDFSKNANLRSQLGVDFFLFPF